jgi:PTH2 family peptidyl-tRNA hydrolase
MSEEYKQVILVRKDLNLSKGKLAAQVAHGAVEAVLKADNNLIKKWRNEGMKKVVLVVNNEKEFYKYLQEAKDFGIPTALITDAGRTEISPGTKTVLAIGPYKSDIIDSITGNLKTL